MVACAYNPNTQAETGGLVEFKVSLGYIVSSGSG